MKEYAEVCKRFKHYEGVSIEKGKCCLACWHFWQEDKENMRGKWNCEIPEESVRRRMYLESQVKGQLQIVAGENTK